MIKLLKVYLVLCMLIACGCRCNTTPKIEVTVKPTKLHYHSYEQVFVKLTYTNKSRHPVQIPAKLAPSDDFWNNIFIIKVDNRKVKYIGRLYRWSNIDKFIVLAPDESISHNIKLDRLYDLRINGAYSIQANIFIGEFIYSSNTAQVFIEGRQNFKPGTRPIDIAGMRTDKCSRSEVSALKASLKIATDWTRKAFFYLDTTSEKDIIKSKQFKTWYGKAKKPDKKSKDVEISKIDNDADLRLIEEKWSVIYQAISKKTIKFYCGCTNAVAFVYPHRAYDIYVCEEFFEWPTKGKNSQAGVIIHEISHFYATANTEDYAYGERACKNLAKRRPPLAARNADNYMYFCSDTYR